MKELDSHDIQTYSVQDTDIDRVRKEIEKTKQVINDLHNLKQGVIEEPLQSILRGVSQLKILHCIRCYRIYHSYHLQLSGQRVTISSCQPHPLKHMLSPTLHLNGLNFMDLSVR